ncbi:MAG TPA: hypothetical protein DHV36_14700 [Desulfobacteraceae bacterium]|nr:hypothetical protein [Desulfobacteraceae bacterium]
MDEQMDSVDSGEGQIGEDQAGYIAVIGMAGRFPKADNIDTFWQNLIDGVECVSFFTPEELAEAGVDPSLSAMPNFVNARAIINDPEMFDNRFFGMPPKEAELTDPQHRLFLETCQTALETAGCDPERYEGYIGVYAGADINSYAMGNLAMAASNTMALLGNDKDYLATRVSFKLNLRGPGITVQTACSTSLVTVHMACQGLLDFHCDIALAGGVGVNFPQKSGYMHTEGAVLSPDGHCRAFDANAKGTPPGDGVGVVVLKRLEEALEDGDVIHAVIRGSAINNDGGMKVGFTAPSIDGQAEVIAMAQETAGVTPEDIGYVEAHGTGTELGDPIEMTALTEAFQAGTDKQGYCAVGSLKTNMGHMNSASGVGGLIKTVLAVKHGKIPPSLNFTEPNPKLNIEQSPFFINTALRDWTLDNGPRIAGVSSFGAGGTNAHAIVEEPPAQDQSSGSRDDQLLVISAKTATALETATDKLSAWLRANPADSLADTAYTLQTGRQLFDHRRFLVCRDAEAAAAALETRQGTTTVTATPGHAPVVFMFPGQGAQYVTMAQGLYEGEPLFREIFDHCADILQPMLASDLREALYPRELPKKSEDKNKALENTSLAQPAIFVIEYAMAKVWMSWGITPESMIGHSIGELTAACLAGVFSLEDALGLVHKRASLMQGMPPGEMVTASLSEADARTYEGVSVAAVNAPNRCVLSGSFEAMAQVKQQLAEKKIAHASLHTSHAFHSEMMAKAMDEFHRAFDGIELNPPKIPYISNITGTWITPEDAVSPEYWAKHIISTVRFGQGAAELLDDPARIFLEAGPGQTLTTLVRANAEKGSRRQIFKSLRHPKDKTSDTHLMLETLGALYCANVAVDWAGFYENETRRKVSLPTYPFERERFWSDPGEKIRASLGKPEGHLEAKIPDVGQWLYCQSWKRTGPAPALPAKDLQKRRCLVLSCDSNPVRAVIDALTPRVSDVTLVTAGNEFYKLDDNRYSVDPEDRKSFEALFAELAETDRMPDHIVHLWELSEDATGSAGRAPYTGFLSLVALAGALGKTTRKTPVSLDVVTTGTADVLGDEPIAPEKTMVLSACRIIPQEDALVNCRVTDIASPDLFSQDIGDRVADALLSDAAEPLVALRGRHRWAEVFEPITQSPAADQVPDTEELLQAGRIRKDGVYLITGGLGNIGVTIAEALAEAAQPALVLTGRSGLPPAEEWDTWLSTHDLKNKTSRRIQKVRHLESLGSKVLVYSGDVSDEGQMAKIIEKASANLSAPICGVVHAAGIVGQEAFCAVNDMDRTRCSQHFHPKVEGLAVLDRLLPPDMDFCVLISSLSTVIGGIGLAAYAAANQYMDAFAQEKNRGEGGHRWISTNWDRWHHEVETAAPSADTASAGAMDAMMRSTSILPDEGKTAFWQILKSLGLSQVVVSVRDLQSSIDQWINLDPDRNEEKKMLEPGARHPRPDMGTEYVAPRNETEEALAEIWSEIFSIEPISVDDNFFQLGGDSLMAIQLAARLREHFLVDVSVNNLFEEPTIADLARKIPELQQENQEMIEDISQKLDMLESLSDEEVKKMLEELGP